MNSASKYSIPEGKSVGDCVIRCYKLTNGIDLLVHIDIHYKSKCNVCLLIEVMGIKNICNAVRWNEWNTPIVNKTYQDECILPF